MLFLSPQVEVTHLSVFSATVYWIYFPNFCIVYIIKLWKAQIELETASDLTNEPGVG